MATNKTIAAQIGRDYTMVSRLRNGKRLPSIETMEQIENAYGWTMNDQIDARRAGAATYSAAFRDTVERFEQQQAKTTEGNRP